MHGLVEGHVRAVYAVCCLRCDVGAIFVPHAKRSLHNARARRPPHRGAPPAGTFDGCVIGVAPSPCPWRCSSLTPVVALARSRAAMPARSATGHERPSSFAASLLERTGQSAHLSAQPPQLPYDRPDAQRYRNGRDQPDDRHRSSPFPVPQQDCAALREKAWFDRSRSSCVRRACASSNRITSSARPNPMLCKRILGLPTPRFPRSPARPPAARSCHVGGSTVVKTPDR